MAPLTLWLSHLAVTVKGCTGDACDVGSLPTVQADSNQVANIMQIVFFAIGALAMVYIIIAGLRLITSLGEDPEALKKVRSSILYASIGVVVCLSAELIISLVIKKL